MEWIEEAAGVISVLVLGLIDYYTGYELSFAVFYLIPISVVSYRRGIPAGIVIALLSGIAWTLAESLYPSSSPGIFIFNSLTRIILFLGMAYVIGITAKSINAVNEQKRTLERLNEEKNKFLGIAAHDLRNPLGVIQLYSDFLLRTDFDESRRDMVSQIKEQSRYMGRLVEDFLDVAKIESGVVTLYKEDIDYIGFLMERIRTNQMIADNKGMTISLDSTRSVPEINLDRNKITQVVNNLLSNAMMYSPEKSHIQVSVSKRGGYILTSVKDQGPGLSKDDMRSISKPFESGRAHKTGEKRTGLGLVIVNHIIESHGGELSVISRAGKGAEFRFSLPLKDNRKDNKKHI
jgi:signal transduction histidine kinase